MEDKRLAEIAGISWHGLMRLADELLGPDEERIESGVIAVREYSPEEAWKMYVAVRLTKGGVVSRTEAADLVETIPGINEQKQWQVRKTDIVTVTADMEKLKKHYRKGLSRAKRNGG